MTEPSEPGDQPPQKETIKRFVLRTTAPFQMETEALGTIVSRRLTVKGSTTFIKRFKSLDGLSNAEVVRAYMGSVSGLPVEDDEQLPDPLTEEQVGRLTDADVTNFARAYLEHIVKPEVLDSDPVAQLAIHIRAEREEHLEATKKMAETIASALKIGSTADYLKNWQELTRSVAGPVERLRDEMQRVLGPVASMKTSLGDTLRAMEADKERALKALGQFDGHIEPREPTFARVDVEPRLLFPPVHETPVGRTAAAVEEMSQVSRRMEEAMGLVLEQAGNVSEKMGQVLSKIEVEAAKSQMAARWAFFVGVLSLVLSAGALAVSAYFSRVGYSADREDARSGDKAMALLTKRIEQQTAMMGDLLAESRKRSGARVGPPVGARRPESAPVQEKAGE